MKILKKIRIWLMIVLVLFSFFYKPQRVRAEALTMTGGMTLAALNPAVLPFAVVGLGALLLLGYTVSNWDEVCAFGENVVHEMAKMGHSISDFVTGTSVNVTGDFKKAVKRVAGNMDNEMTSSTVPIDSGNYKVITGEANKVRNGLYSKPLLITSKSEIYIGVGEPEGSVLSYHKYRDNADIVLPSMTVIVDVEPTNVNLKIIGGDAHVDKSETTPVRNELGQTVSVIRTFSYSKRPKYEPIAPKITTDLNGESFVITGVSIPELGISEKAKPISNREKLKSSGIDSASVDQYIDTAFPNDETVTFDMSANVSEASLLNLPKVSDKQYTGEQIKTLSDIQAKARTEAGESISSNTGSLANTGTGFLEKLWEWLKQLLDAILGIPGAILAGLKALWDWLARILAAIQAIPGVISKGIVDVVSGISEALKGALTWAFGIDQAWLQGRLGEIRKVFNAKFPALTPINYTFTDKTTFDDLKMMMPNVGEVVVVRGAVVMQYAPVLKNFMRAFLYLLTALFFFKRFYKVAED